MFYDKKIKYLDYYERGERIKGCGFVRIEARDGELKITLTISGLHPTDSFARDVILCTERQEKTLTQIALTRGGGEVRRIYHNLRDIGGTGIPYWELCGISIRLGGEREVACRWSKSENKAAEQIISSGESARGTGGLENAVSVERISRAAESTEKEALVAESAQTRENPERETEQTKKSPKQQAKPVETPPEREEYQQRMLEDKWQQLSAIYPHIQPFRDERDYLSIRPADFLLFPEAAYRQVNNSFLLHGYYNYKHLLLSRVERRGEIMYYVGVPGNYYEKEKQVAIMFGFESFECAEEPAQEGDFGYYMMRTQL